MSTVATRAVGAPVDRVEGREKVTGQAKYAFEHEQEGLAYAHLVQSTIAKGMVRGVEELELPGLIAVLTAHNAPRLADAEGELAVLQSPRVSYRGQIVAIVVAESLEAAREAERVLRVEYDEEEHDVVLRDGHPKLYKPESVNPGFETDTDQGDFDAAFEAAPVQVDHTYETPAFHNNAMEPHATIASWEDGGLVLHDSTQGPTQAAGTIAKAFGLEPGQVRVISPHVGGGFGSKGTPRPHVIAAGLAAKVTGRPVKLAVTRQQMFPLTGYRTPTIQRVRLGAERDGRLTAIAHDALEQTSTVDEFAEQTAVVTRMMYAGANRRTTHRLAPLDVPTPSWMRAPGECPGMYALECAMDELAIELGIDPVELRIRNDPEIDPETGNRFSSRNLVACLRDGAERFGWAGRDPTPGARREGRRLIGTGVAASTYPARRQPSQATVSREADGSYFVRLGAADIGTGARTVLTQIAADELDAPVERVRLELGDTAFPPAFLAGGSMGTVSWGSAVIGACRKLLEEGGDEATYDSKQEVEADEKLARHSFGAQFAEVSVDVDTGEIRVPRLLGVFATGRIVNPKTARSQFLGGMTMGLGMALLEESIMDERHGDYVNHDLAGYHVATAADAAGVEAYWIEEEETTLGPLGAKGIGEIGIVGTAAAIANAVHHATGARIRELPIRIDRVLAFL